MPIYSSHTRQLLTILNSKLAGHTSLGPASYALRGFSSEQICQIRDFVIACDPWNSGQAADDAASERALQMKTEGR